MLIRDDIDSRYVIILRRLGLDRLFNIMRGDFIDIGFIIVHIGHVNLFGVILVDKYIGFNKFDAFVMNTDLDCEVVA